MQFKNPELLYALFLLIIPILVHLFQLRRFKKEAFTNVAFLKKINIQTRKSNTIKKWLVLLTRMLALACIILAFAQPYVTKSESATRPKETIVYLDNSFSMQAKGSSGALLKQAVQDLITQAPEDEELTILTNDETFRNTSVKNFRSELLQIPYSSLQLKESAITLKAQKEFSNDPSTDKRLILISDFQNQSIEPEPSQEGLEKFYVQLLPVIRNNVSIDSVYISQIKTNSLELTVKLSSQELKEGNTSVSLYNGELLLAKGAASFAETKEALVKFDVENINKLQGKISIEDPLLPYDNVLYFSINKARPVKVLAINGSSSNYLERIFTQPEFTYTATDLKNLDFSAIPDYNYIVLNEVQNISSALSSALSAFAKAGGVTTIILSSKGDLSSYSQALQTLGSFQVGALSSSEKLVTTINYDHPIYRDVFDNRTKNFQYPTVSSAYEILGGDVLLKFDDGKAFLTERNGIFIISGAIDTANSNLKNSPLIVPTFYNMARQSLSLPSLYVTIGTTNNYDIPIALPEDDVIQLQATLDNLINIIPLQQSRGNKVSITTSQEPSSAGIYNVRLADSIIQDVSYNYNREESIMQYQDFSTAENLNYQTSVTNLFDNLKSADSVQSLWKWFVIFALFFLLLEILILKLYR